MFILLVSSIAYLQACLFQAVVHFIGMPLIYVFLRMRLFERSKKSKKAAKNTASRRASVMSTASTRSVGRPRKQTQHYAPPIPPPPRPTAPRYGWACFLKICSGALSFAANETGSRWIRTIWFAFVAVSVFAIDSCLRVIRLFKCLDTIHN